MSKLKILLVDDDDLCREVLAAKLAGHSIDTAANMAAAERKLKPGAYDICFLDLLLGRDDDYSGLKLIPKAVAAGAYTVVMSSCDTEDTIDKAYALGCKEFYVKGNEDDNVAAIIARYLQGDGDQKAQHIFASQFITNDPATRALVKEALKYAPTGLPLMILGPSGTGKTTLAELIHTHSGRQGAFVALNCAAYTEDLLEAELFGYRKGAFTGAAESRKGKLAQADGGTLFLDEIGSMSQNMQVKLLKAIEEKCFYPLGADRPEYSDFRVLSATLEDVQRLLADGRMRFDFFQRIHGLTVTLRPLAERKCDLFPLLHAFTKGKRRLAFDQAAKDHLLSHDWPGNTRELRRFTELLAAGSRGQVTLEAVKKLVTPAKASPAAAAPDGELTQAQYERALRHGLADASDRFAAAVINRCLAESGGKKAAVLEKLKISKTLLYAALAKPGKDGDLYD